MGVTSANVTTVECRSFGGRERSWSARVRVETDDRLDNAITVAAYLMGSAFALGQPMSAAAGIGNNFDVAAYVESYGGITLTDAEADGKTWDADVVYSVVAPPEGKKSQPQGSPLDQEPEISMDGVRVQVPLPEKDSFGRSIVNSAGDPFLDTMDAGETVIRVRMNVATVSPLWGLDIDYVNAANFFGRGPRFWKTEPPRIRQRPYGSGYYFECDFEFRGRRGGWDFAPVDRGPRDEDGNAPETAKGIPVIDDAALLDGAGQYLAAGGTAYLFDGQNGRAAAFRIYQEIDFAALGVPTDWLT